MERLERLVVADYKAHDGAPSTHLGRLAQGHRVRRRLDGIQAAARKWLRPDRIWRMEVRPETAAAAKAP
jgi:hypothetical protein